MPRLRFFACLAFLLFLFPLYASAQKDTITNNLQNNLSATGNVYLADMAHPAANILIHVRSEQDSDLIDTTTSESGYFNIYGLKPAIYVIDVDLDGFRRSETSIDLQFGSVRNVQITLIPAVQAGAGARAGTVSSHQLSIPAKAREEFQAGRIKLYEQNDPTGALEDFNLALAVAPSYYEAEYESAMAYLAQGKKDEAAKAFQKSIDMSEQKYGPGFVGLGTMAIDKKDNAEGEKLVRQGVALNPDYWLGQFELGRVLAALGKTADAAKAAEQAKSLAPSEPVIYRLLTIIHLQEKDYRAAVADIDQYVKLDPDSAAGRRAKELRDQVAQKIDQPATPVAPAASDAPPKLRQ
jgi:tetratricopeptide (TPR) repeat protein